MTTATTTATLRTRVVCVRSIPGGYYAPAVLETCSTLTGKLIWYVIARPLGEIERHGHLIEAGVRSQAEALRLAQEYAEAQGIPFLPSARAGKQALL